MRLNRFLAAAGAAVLLSGPAQATVDRGWYIGLEAGWSEVGDNAYAGVRVPGPGAAVGALTLDSGFLGLMTAGYGFTPNWRAELELGLRSNDIDGFCAPGCVPTFGSVEQFSQMLNIVYDWHLGNDWSLATGLGFGGNYVEADTLFGQDNDYVFAAQAIVGFNYHVTDRMDVILNYRYMVSDDLALASADPTAPGQVWVAAADGPETHALTIGLRFDLNPSAAPVHGDPGPQPGPPEPSKQYIVFFGFNKSNLTSEAQSVVAEAAAAANRLGSATIRVVGHTDTVGGNAYNDRLSVRRANVVRDELERLGVKSKITATGRGEAELMVGTGDNVKEPQNRRATIDLD